MPLPPALAARLAKRGLIQSSTSAAVNKTKNKENSSSDSSDRPRFVEEVIAESYDPPNKSSSSGGAGGSSSLSSGSGPSVGVVNRKIVGSSGITKFHRMGHYGCPNKNNIHHTCSQYCVTRYGRGKVQPNPIYNRRRLKMLKKYALPVCWLEIYDPGTGRYYYWNTDTDDVCWTSPTYPKAIIGRAAPELREKIIEDEMIEANKPVPSNSELMKKSLKKLRPPDKPGRRKQKEELDPMDPASYSDISRGTWSSGLRNEENSGVDSTASGPLFQQRPYPSPGDILKANRKPT